MQDKSKSYLTFRLNEEVYAAHVRYITNIIEMTGITAVPQSPEYLKGVINLRGMVLPVIDTRLKMGMTETELTESTCIVVLDLHFDNETVFVGIIVEEVLAVHEFEETQIGPPPSIGNRFKTDYVTGVVEVNGNFILLLDLLKVFSPFEAKQFAEQQD
jgi:purine-binding chemotaxis protein CheW